MLARCPVVPTGKSVKRKFRVVLAKKPLMVRSSMRGNEQIIGSTQLADGQTAMATEIKG